MADPAALNAISTSFKIIGGVLETSRKNSADRQAAHHNATILEQQAHDEQASAALKARERRRDTRQRVGTQTALLAADGQAVDTGDALRLTQDLQSRGDFLADLDESEGQRVADAKRRDARFEIQTADTRSKARTSKSLLNAFGQGVGGFVKSRRMY